MTGLYKGKLVCITDISFFLEKLHLISAAWVALVDQVIVAKGDFISSVLIEYAYPFTAEIYRVLAIIIVINHMLIKYPNILSTLYLTIRLDYQLVLDNLWNSLSIITWTRYLYQLIREIKRIQYNWSLKLRPEKIKVYQDNIISSEKLTWLERLNIMCNTRAKELVKNENRSIVPFPFELTSPFLLSTLLENLISNKEYLILYVSLV